MSSLATTTVAPSAALDQRFLSDFAILSAFGATPAGGVERQAASAEDGKMRDWLTAWLRDRGFTVVLDRIGNMFGLIELRPGAPYVLIGSHMDSQPRGGKYDGAYGVLAGAHAAERLVEEFSASGSTPQYNIAVVNWFNEEGSRFKPGMMGSGVFTHKLSLRDALDSVDPGGVTAEQALRGIGAIADADGLTAAQIAGYLEIHIEQGRELDRSGTVLGVVHSTWAASKYELVIHGAQAHTGATAIADRRDALYGASLVVVTLRELADHFGVELHTSCGELTVYPNSPVVVPREVSMHMDLRSSSDDLLAQADSELQKRLLAIEVQANVRIEQRVAHAWKGSAYPSEGVDLALQVAADLGVSSMLLRTRAGHDSTNLKDLVPTVMLFVPSVDGVSHAEAEYTRDEDLCAGVNVLTETLARMVEGHLPKG